MIYAIRETGYGWRVTKCKTLAKAKRKAIKEQADYDMRSSLYVGEIRPPFNDVYLIAMKHWCGDWAEPDYQRLVARSGEL